MKQEIANTVFLQDKFWYRDREGSPACVPELAQKSFRLPARMGLFSLSRHTLKNLTQMTLQIVKETCYPLQTIIKGAFRSHHAAQR